MTKIPITLLFFTSTKGHYGHKDIYLSTLNHLDKQLALNDIATKVAHIKISPSEQILGDEMEAELVRRGFKVLKTVAGWTRGLSHQNGYTDDLLKVSKEASVYDNPYVLWLEDDSLIVPKKSSILELISRMTDMLATNPDLLSARLLRASDLSSSPIQQASIDYFYSPHFNFQPAVLRSRDFYLVNKMVEDNNAALAQVQIEMIWRLVMAPFSRSDLKHVVFFPDFAETIHIGVQDYPQIKVSLGL